MTAQEVLANIGPSAYIVSSLAGGVCAGLLVIILANYKDLFTRIQKIRHRSRTRFV